MAIAPKESSQEGTQSLSHVFLIASEGNKALSWLQPIDQRCIMRSCWIFECGACVSSAKREVTHSTAALGYAGAFAGYIWNPSVTATGCLMILGMLVALPFALKLPKQAKWLKDSPPGRVRSCVFLCCSDTSSSSLFVLQETACSERLRKEQYCPTQLAA